MKHNRLVACALHCPNPRWVQRRRPPQIFPVTLEDVKSI